VPGFNLYRPDHGLHDPLPVVRWRVFRRGPGGLVGRRSSNASVAAARTAHHQASGDAPLHGHCDPAGDHLKQQREGLVAQVVEGDANTGQGRDLDKRLQTIVKAD
jgi:hypothetical protein